MDQEVMCLQGRSGEPSLSLRRSGGAGAPVLYIHGATFPSALSVGYRFAGRSWMDDLAVHGYDAWALDFAGFGNSERCLRMSGGREGAPLGRALEAHLQIARAVERIVEVTGRAQVSIVAHSWGTVAAGLYTTRHADRIKALCLFGPIAQRALSFLPAPENVGAWRLVTVDEQLARFVEDVPAGQLPVLIEPELEKWGPAYLASDADAAARTPPAVKIPAGPQADILAAWRGDLGYRPEDIRVPTLVVRGEWDRTSSDADADWLLSQLASPIRGGAKIARATHLAHLEYSRDTLFYEVRNFLARV